MPVCGSATHSDRVPHTLSKPPPTQVIQGQGKHPITCVLLLPQPEHMLAAGAGGGAGGGGRQGPKRPQPLAPLNKFLGEQAALLLGVGVWKRGSCCSRVVTMVKCLPCYVQQPLEDRLACTRLSIYLPICVMPLRRPVGLQTHHSLNQYQVVPLNIHK